MRFGPEKISKDQMGRNALGRNKQIFNKKFRFGPVRFGPGHFGIVCKKEMNNLPLKLITLSFLLKEYVSNSTYLNPNLHWITDRTLIKIIPLNYVSPIFSNISIPLTVLI